MNERVTGAPSIESGESIEQKREQVDEWIKNISEKQKVGKEVNQELLREVLISYGANFENLNEEGREGLRGYSEKKRGPGVRQVWGNEFVDDYKGWAKRYLTDYELKTGIKWPILKKKEHPEKSTNGKWAGVNQFLFWLTRRAAGEGNNIEDNKEMETRIKNGIALVKGKKEERKKFDLPEGKGEKLISSIPGEFPIAAMDWIKNCVKNRVSEPPLQQ